MLSIISGKRVLLHIIICVLGMHAIDVFGDSRIIQQLVQLQDAKVELRGVFGQHCNGWEIIVDYGGGFEYAHQAFSMQE